jgi:VWFA-related protein
VKTPTYLAGLSCALVALMASSQSTPQGPSPLAEPGVAGRWRLNEKDSEDPRVKFSPTRARRPGESEGEVQGPGTSRWPRRGEPERADGRPQPEAQSLTGPREFLDAPRGLTIAASGQDLTLRLDFSDGNATVRLRVDGEQHAEPGVTRIARWEGPSLVVESALDTGAQLLARYNPMPGGRRLEVYSRYRDKDGAVFTLRRVFEADHETAPSAPATASAETRADHDVEPSPAPPLAVPPSEEGAETPSATAAPRPALPAATAGRSGEGPTFGVTTELVYVRFHLDRKGGRGEVLRKDQIRVLENGRPQSIALLETPSSRERSVPPEVVLALDVSSSVMDARLLDETLVRDVFFAGLSEQTTVGLCAFGGELRCLVPPTRDIRALLGGFEQALLFSRETRHQGTRLYASVADICNTAAEAGAAQRALVVFSDGLDNRGGKVEEASQVAQRTDVRVYAIKLSQAFRDSASLRSGGLRRVPNRALYDYRKFDLDRLASETGGRTYEPATLDERSLADILRSIAGEIRTEFIVGFQPEGPATGEKRRVKVELVDKSLGSIRGGERTLVR